MSTELRLALVGLSIIVPLLGFDSAGGGAPKPPERVPVPESATLFVQVPIEDKSVSDRVRAGLSVFIEQKSAESDMYSIIITARDRVWGVPRIELSAGDVVVLPLTEVVCDSVDWTSPCVIRVKLAKPVATVSKVERRPDRIALRVSRVSGVFK